MFRGLRKSRVDNKKQPAKLNIASSFLFKSHPLYAGLGFEERHARINTPWRRPKSTSQNMYHNKKMSACAWSVADLPMER
jgi:hypothetical protein